VDIEEFYEEDPRRQKSEELQFGRDWHDAHGRRYELNWVEDTGELYVMQDDPPPVWMDPFGDVIPIPADVDDLRVRVLKLVPGRDQLMQLLDGWEDVEAQPDSIAWLVRRLWPAPHP
jgi:hypothetical protein